MFSNNGKFDNITKLEGLNTDRSSVRAIPVCLRDGSVLKLSGDRKSVKELFDKLIFLTAVRYKLDWIVVGNTFGFEELSAVVKSLLDDWQTPLSWDQFSKKLYITDRFAVYYDKERNRGKLRLEGLDGKEEYSLSLSHVFLFVCSVQCTVLKDNTSFDVEG